MLNDTVPMPFLSLPLDFCWALRKTTRRDTEQAFTNEHRALSERQTHDPMPKPKVLPIANSLHFILQASFSTVHPTVH